MENTMDYGASKIQVILYTPEELRKRPGMYIGDTNLRGISNVIKELLKDLAKLGNGAMQLNCYKGLRFKLMSANSDTKTISAILQNLVDFKDKHHLFIKYDGFHLAHGFSKNFKATLQSKTENITLRSKEGVSKALVREEKASASATLSLEFTLDPKIFKDVQQIPYAKLRKDLKQWMYLQPHLSLTLKCEKERPDNWHFPNGIKDLYDERVAEFGGRMMAETEIRTQILGLDVHLCFGYSIWGQHISIAQTFCNDDEMLEDVVLMCGVLTGIQKVVKASFEEVDEYKDEENRSVKDGLICMIHLKGKEVTFGGPTRHRLDMPQLVEPITKVVEEALTAQIQEKPNVFCFWRLDRFPFRLCEAANKKPNME